MASGTFYIPAGASDFTFGDVDTQAWYPTLAQLYLGKGASNNKLHSGVRFGSVNIPQGATITTALLSFISYSNASGTTVDLKVHGNDVDNASAPGNWTTAYNLTKTTAEVAWSNVEAWTLGNRHYAPDIKDIVQEIVSRAGWASGNALQLMVITQDSNSNNVTRMANAYEASSTDVQLYVEWEEDIAGELTEGLTLDDSFLGDNTGDTLAEALTLNGAFSYTDTADILTEGFTLNAAFLPNDFVVAGPIGEALTLSFALVEDVVYSNHYQIAATFPMMTATGEMRCRSLAVQGTFPMMTMEASIIGGQVLSVAQTLPMMTISGSILTGSVLAITGTFPMMTISASGWTNNLLTITATFPMMRITASMRPAAPTYTAIAMNPGNLAVTEYTSFPFNSYAYFNGLYLGAKSTGIHKLTGANDGGAAIAASLKLGKLPMEHTKARDIWIAGKSTGHMRVSISVDEGADAHQEADYLVATLGQDRVTVPRGNKPIYLQIGITNESGSGFDIDGLQILGEFIKRKKR